MGGDDAEPPLKRAADLDSLCLSAGRSLLAALPPPKCTLGMDTGVQGSGGVKIDLSGLAKPRSRPQEPGLAEALRSNPDAPPEVAEDDEVPDSAVNHPMFGGLGAADAGEGSNRNGPTAE